jgi:lysophospholipase L1-like esterase
LLWALPISLLLLVGCNGSPEEPLPEAPAAVDEPPPEEEEEPEEEEPEEEEPEEEEPEEEEPEEEEPEEEEPEEEEPEDPELSDFELCFEDILDTSGNGPDYDQFGATIGSHCNGTNHQEITGIERVVFLGDSVTVGTPPSSTEQLYRNILALELADRFGLEAPGFAWQNVNVFGGASYVQDEGDFASCAKWGARADDLMQDDSQVMDCFPPPEREKATLVVMTIGGNDLANLTEGFIDGRPTAELWDQTFEMMDLVRETVEWLTAPGRFPNGVHVVTTNLYEFTDGTGDTASCPAAGLAGFGAAITDPALEEMVLWSMEEFMSIAVDPGTDMLVLLETFCGHGFLADDPNGRCYRGPNTETWFDLTCIHPNPTGHRAIADMFLSVVLE